MRILFVAKHGCGDNNDEDSVAHALRQLGHTVKCIHENPKLRGRFELEETRDDLCLFLKWPDVAAIRRVAQRMPCALWYFDLVRTDDPTLLTRARSRQQWFAQVLPSCLVGFCTDGEWVKEYNFRYAAGRQALDLPPKLVHLMQGADERVVGPGTPPLDPSLLDESKGRGTPTDSLLANPDGTIDILFTGMINHGAKRAAHIHELQARYGSRFVVHGDGGPNHRSHGRELANLIARAKIVLAPDGPNSDNYYSNRVFLTLGFGGFLLHPYCAHLARLYGGGNGCWEPKVRGFDFYSGRDGCNRVIDYYLDRPEERAEIAQVGYQRTLKAHLYRHRVATLIEEITKRL